MKPRYFFGYGSLVNRDTHDFSDAHPARLKGWRRVWRHTTWQPRPFLTVEPDPDCQIEGLIAHVPDDDWHALDQREAGYDRVPVSHLVEHPATASLDIATYSVPDGKHDKPSDDLPIALSYLDVVIQGYLREFGEAGAAGFFTTTAGWDAPIRNDRAAPIYSRHVPVTREVQDFVDERLARLSARVRL